jgi:hypothetical protein
MKKVISNPSKETVFIDSITDRSIVGFSINGLEKGWLQPMGYDDDEAIKLSINGGVSHANFWSHINGKRTASKKECVKHLISIPNNQVYVFDNEKELFRWLGE